MKQLLAELRRRNVFRVAAAYLVGGWLVLQIVGAIEASAGLPDWTDGMALVVLLIGLPIALVIAWAFELTPEGLQKTSARDPSAPVLPIGGTDYALIGLMVLVLAFMGYQLIAGGERSTVFVEDVSAEAVGGPGADLVAASQPAEAELAEATFQPPQQSVAVLPFVAMSANADDGYFADGLTEEILNSLALLPDLLVTSRTSAFQFKGDDLPSTTEIARQLGVAHIVEGSVRRAGDQVRITVQFIRASDDSHLWSQTYDRSMDDVFAIQEDIADNIAQALNIVIDEGSRQRMRDKGVVSVEAFVAYQQAMVLYEEAHNTAVETAEALALVDPIFVEATRLDPGFSDAYFMQSDYYSHTMLNAVGETSPDATVRFAEAQRRYNELVDLAFETSSNSERRALISISRVYLSDNWTGTNQIIDQIAAIDNCATDNWLVDLVTLSGRSRELIPFFERQSVCDPLSPSVWTSLGRVQRAAGDFSDAADTFARGLAVDPGASDFIHFQLETLFLAERYDELYAALDLYQISHDRYELLMAARTGDAERVSEMLAAANDNLRVFTPYDWWNFSSSRIALMAQLNRRAEVNALVADLDRSPLSATTLIVAIQQCRCGAPWDLDYTPNFAARLAEAEFPWPPAGAGEYALKEW
jgi:adenylate cyclase